MGLQAIVQVNALSHSLLAAELMYKGFDAFRLCSPPLVYCHYAAITVPH